MRQRATPPKFLIERQRGKAKRRRHRDRQRRARTEKKRSKFLRKLAGASQLPAVVLKAPSRFAILEPQSFEPLVQFLRRLVHLTLVDGRIVCIDFRPVVKFWSDGTMLFYAELQRILARRKDCVKCLLPTDPVAREVLCQIGVLKQLGCNRTFPSTRDDVIHWKVLTGVLADATLGVGQAIEALPRLDHIQMSRLFRSVTEALTNVTQHAYTEPRKDGTGRAEDRQWWMFVRQVPEQLTVIFCDLGLGVPYTVPLLDKHRGWLSARLQSVLHAIGVRSHQDGETIQVTVDEKRSRFQKDHRGNGFGNMLESISVIGQGRLSIVSNRGVYNFTLRRGKERHEARNYTTSIFGTVIGWHIDLPKVAA